MKKVDIPLLFGQTRALEAQIDEFLDKVSEGALILKKGVVAYMDDRSSEVCAESVRQITEYEHRGDRLRDIVVTALYTQMLLPDSRGEVARLLHALDDLLDECKHFLETLEIENPDVPEEFRPSFKDLVSAVANCVECTVLAARAFFRDNRSVRDHVHKIGFHESDSDKVGSRLRKRIFSSDLPLDRKMLLRDTVVSLEALADDAEDVGDLLSVFAIKRAR
jgi:predicted phosphate transport protein (TIGR00153 family)